MTMTKKKVMQSAQKNCCETSSLSMSARWAEIGVMLIVLVALYQAGKGLSLFSFALTTDNVVGLGTAFLIGLTASVSSCLAMVGGLLLSVSSSWAIAHPGATTWEKFKPQLHFNVGRLVGYFIFGGLTGLLGQQLLLSVQGTGILKIALSLIMLLLGLNILGVIPKRYCRMPLPKALLERIRGMGTSDSILAPLSLGSLTYFVPCGFTQSMQALALLSGDFWTGGTLMFVFALGTLPSLLGISTIGSVAHGKFGRMFGTFAGSLTLLLGLSNLHTGMVLTGIDLSLPQFTATALESSDVNVTIDKNGQQIISVGVQENGYSANNFTIEADTPTWIYALAPEPISGCISSLVIPDFNVTTTIRKGGNWIGPITPKKDFAFMCSMGMFKADVHVRS